MIYNFNIGIGWASSGVEYAQVYRAKLLRELGMDSKFIFTDLILNENIQHLTANIGMKDEEVIWLYTYFTDIKICPTSFNIEQLKASFEEEPDSVEQNTTMIRYHFKKQNLMVTGFFSKHSDQTIERVEYASQGKLIRKDYYTYMRVFTEYYAPKDNQAKAYQRRYYNEDGSTAYEEIIDGNDSVFRVDHNIFYTKDEFIAHFVKSLNLKKKDIVIVDRASKMAQPIFEHKGKAKVGVVIHAEHYNQNFENEKNILWNNFYEYQFTNYKHVDFFITATSKQRQVLEKQFQELYDAQVKVYDIPVGALDELVKPSEVRKRFSLVTASRLADEKHIDWIAEAVLKARKQLPDLNLDIYGTGKQEQRLNEIIKAHDAASYIQLKGHQEMSQRYKDYEVYISASTSEGFGLTLMEAVGSGLAMLGFDVPYGNQTFIQDGKNGVLIPYEAENDVVANLAEALVRIFEYPMPEMSQASYDIANEFLKEKIANKWQELVKELSHDS